MDDLGEATALGYVRGRHARGIAQRRIRMGGQEQPADLGIAAARGRNQRRVPGLVRHVEVGMMTQQRPHRLSVPGGGCDQQRRVTRLGPRIHVRVRQEQPDKYPVGLAGCGMQRRQSVRVRDILARAGAEQRAHLRRRPQGSRVPQRRAMLRILGIDLDVMGQQQP